MICAPHVAVSPTRSIPSPSILDTNDPFRNGTGGWKTGPWKCAATMSPTFAIGPQSHVTYGVGSGPVITGAPWLV